MAQINFPEPQANGEIFDKDGVLYQYSGNPPSGFWKANSQNVVDDAYINTSGDIMSGDLTLTGLSGLGEAILGVDENGRLIRGNALSEWMGPYIKRTGDSFNGSITLEDNLGNPRIDLNHQSGDVSLAGDLQVGTFDIDDPTADASTKNGGGLKGGKLYAKQIGSNDNNVYEGYSASGVVTSNITGAGNAQFNNIELNDGELAAPFISAGGGSLASYAGIPNSMFPIRVKDESDVLNFGVATNGTVYIGGSLTAAVPAPAISLGQDGTANYSNEVSATKFNSSGDVLIGGDLKISSYGINQAGTTTVGDLTCNSVSTTSADLGSITGQSLDLSGNITSSHGATFGSDISVTGAVSATGAVSGSSANFSGNVTASDYGAVSGSTATFTGAVNADAASVTQSITAGSASISGDCTVGLITSNSDAVVQGSGTFTNNVSCDGINSTDSVNASVALANDFGLKISQGGSVNASIAGNGEAVFAANKMAINANGDIVNINNSYGAISDKKFKTNIVEASSQWKDIKNINLVNYNFKPSYGFGDSKYLGVIAQDLRANCPSLVEVKDDVQKITTPEFDEHGLPVFDELGNQKTTQVIQKTGTQTQSVKYSVLHLKALGALQEAMERIESLEAKVKQLENK